MPDTYHVQSATGADRIGFTSTGTQTAGIVRNPDTRPDVVRASLFVAANSGIFPVMEWGPPGVGATWPAAENNRPQYRLPSAVSAPYVPPVSSSGFSALTLAP